ncbi:diguanylate cyclase [Paenibacillus sp. 19GGS1-52]|uniref:sensor domain-containing diguanylate cyclase n=1 Tax=Paenibacillus sp. 19GGS1-52 TaxID=2758563 RepID=UPI001EFB6683|nr:diguanylate cyclase [Paenibacillus sp. 19GGS1-52]ULO05856.1 diguanylate cyclase [Paenibacillus sp. 19GGS1-52]
MKPRFLFVYFSGKRTIIFWIFICAVVLLIHTESAVASASIVKVQEQGFSLKLDSYLTIIEDKDKNKDIQDILKAVESGTVKPQADPKMNFGRTDSVYWAYVEIVNDTDKEVTTVYDIAGRNEHVELFIENAAGGFTRKLAGTEYPYQQSGLKYRNIAYEIKLLPHESKKVILRNASLLVRFPVTLWDQDSYIAKNTRDALLLGITYGIFLIMFVYNFFLLLFLKEKTYLYYILLVLSNWFFFMVINGTAFKYIWPAQPFWETRSYMFFNMVTMVLLFLFIRSFLETRKFAPRLDRLIRFWIVYCSIGVAASLGLDFVTSRTLLPFINFPSVAFAVLIGVLMLRKQGEFAASYLFSFIPSFIGGMIYLLKQFGVLPFNAITEYSLQIGFTLQIALVSIALANKINMLKSRLIVVEQAALQSQKDLTHQLSEKVKERTCELEIANAELEKLSRLDSLTSLYNRRYLDQALQEELKQHIAEQAELSVLICDIDYFKNYNDTYGHVAGDWCIRQVAEAISGNCERYGVVARFGGEEFVVILPRTDLQGAAVFGEAIRKSVADLQLPHTASDKQTVSISIGIASGIPASGLTENEVLTLADEALYVSKATGRDRVTSIPSLTGMKKAVQM